VARALVLVDSWFTRLRKDCSLERLLGEEYAVIAVVMDGSTWYPSDDSWNPAKVTWCLKDWHLSVFNKILQSVQHCKNMLFMVSDVAVINIKIINYSTAQAQRCTRSRELICSQ